VGGLKSAVPVMLSERKYFRSVASIFLPIKPQIGALLSNSPSQFGCDTNIATILACTWVL
jgi:hypothetical protein